MLFKNGAICRIEVECGRMTDGYIEPWGVVVDGKTFTNNVTKWSTITEACYLRGCNCTNCPLVPELKSTKRCEIKRIVRALFLLNKKPKVKFKSIL